MKIMTVDSNNCPNTEDYEKFVHVKMALEDKLL